MTDKRFSNGAIQQYNDLVQQGYYLRPEKFRNTTVYSICKDLNKNSTERRIFGEVGQDMSEILVQNFGFHVSEPVEYFGKTEPVEKFCIRHWPREIPAEPLFK